MSPADPVALACTLSRVHHALTAELTAALSGLGITPRKHSVLHWAATGDLTQTRLTELCDLDKTTMVVTVDELESAGLVGRKPSPSDRRARIVVLTRAGKLMLAKADEAVASINEEILGELPARERAAFLSSLDRLLSGRLSDVSCEGAVRRRSVRNVS